MEVAIDKMDPGLAALALDALGLSGSVQYVNGTLVISGGQNQDWIVGQVRQAYSAEVVKSQARKYGWTLKQTAPFKYQVIRR
jgi:hypothetical protein